MPSKEREKGGGCVPALFTHKFSFREGRNSNFFLASVEEQKVKEESAFRYRNIRRGKSYIGSKKIALVASQKGEQSWTSLPFL